MKKKMNLTDITVIVIVIVFKLDCHQNSIKITLRYAIMRKLCLYSINKVVWSGIWKWKKRIIFYHEKTSRCVQRTILFVYFYHSLSYNDFYFYLGLPFHTNKNLYFLFIRVIFDVKKISRAKLHPKHVPDVVWPW